METEKNKPPVVAGRLSRKPTTLWKRWKPSKSRLSKNSLLTGRKPTTLWKRWKPSVFVLLLTFFFLLSETHYSLKEMETILELRKSDNSTQKVGNPLLSERDGNSSLIVSVTKYIWPLSETHYSLKEMETQLLYWPHRWLSYLRRKPTTLWKRWKPLHSRNLQMGERIFVGNPLLSERDGNCL